MLLSKMADQKLKLASRDFISYLFGIIYVSILSLHVCVLLPVTIAIRVTLEESIKSLSG